MLIFIILATPNKTNSARSKTVEEKKNSPNSVYSKGYQYKQTAQDRRGRGNGGSQTRRAPSSKKSSKSPVSKQPKQLKKEDVGRISKHWNTDEVSIRDILDQYFTYCMTELCQKNNIKDIVVGKFLEKKLFVKQKSVNIRVTNITFWLNSDGTNSKDFRISDIIDFSY